MCLNVAAMRAHDLANDVQSKSHAVVAMCSGTLAEEVEDAWELAGIETGAFVADTYAAMRGDAPDGLPTFADGVRAARLTAAVLESSAKQAWVEVA